MVGSGLIKLAAKNGMKVSKGVAYGNLRGYAATLSEGAGWKQIAFSVTFPDSAQRGAFVDVVNTVNVQKLYRVRQLGMTTKNIVVIFIDSPGTMKKITEFLNWFVPLLDQYSATKFHICPECGGQVTDGCWKLIDGVAHYMHSNCAENVRTAIKEANAERATNEDTTYEQGFIGAILGGLLGAVLWALVLNMGYIVSVLGLGIGYLADKGYNLFRGRQGKGKIAALIISVIIAVVIGTIGADVITLVSMIAEGESYLTYGEIPRFLMRLLVNDAEYRGAVIKNGFIGLLYAGLGVVFFIMKTSASVSGTKFVDLK